MSEAIANAGAPAQQAPEGQKAETGDVLDIVLDGMKEPVKVPVSKIPVEKLQPQLAKFRAEADRRMSEADRLSKETSARWGKVSALAAQAKDNPDVLADLAKELGVPEGVLDAMSEKRIAKAIERQLQQAEEQQDPSKKAAREAAEERERLRQENERLRKERETETATATRQRVEGVIVAGLDKLPEKLRTPHAAQEMVAFLRATVEERTEALGREPGLDELGITIDDLVTAAKRGWRDAALKYLEADEEGEIPDWLLKRVEAKIAARPAPARHPSAGTGGTAKSPAPRNGKSDEPPANRLLGMLRLT